MILQRLFQSFPCLSIASESGTALGLEFKTATTLLLSSDVDDG